LRTGERKFAARCNLDRAFSRAPVLLLRRKFGGRAEARRFAAL